MRMYEKIVLSGKEKGRYKAFPTVVRIDGQIITVFREGKAEPATPHGINGCVKMAKSLDLKHWDEFDVPFCDSELDAIISKADNNNLFLVTRSYDYKDANSVYISKFGRQEIPKTREIIQFENADFAMFGHIFKHKDRFFATAYGRFGDVHSPAVFEFCDLSATWRIKSLITPGGNSPVLNETTITKCGGMFLAVMRSREPSYDLYTSTSTDLIEWSIPKKTGILGHAPMIGMLSSGQAAFVFRDLNTHLNGVSLALSFDCHSWEMHNIESYSGNLYNGGYADFVEIEPNVLLVVYYISDEDNEPWIEGAVIKI